LENRSVPAADEFRSSGQEDRAVAGAAPAIVEEQDSDFAKQHLTIGIDTLRSLVPWLALLVGR